MRGGPNEGSNVRAFDRGCGNEVDGGERRGGGRKGRKKGLTRKGKGKVGVERTGVPYIKVQEAEAKVSLTACNRLAAARGAIKRTMSMGPLGLAEGKGGKPTGVTSLPAEAYESYCTCALHSLALLAKRRSLD